jgi:hypothetical protein
MSAKRRLGAVFQQHPPFLIIEVGGKLPELVLGRPR